MSTRRDVLTFRRFLLAIFVAFFVVLLSANRVSMAADASPAVAVLYNKGETELDVFKQDVKLFSNRNYAIEKIPNELMGLTFTRSGGGAQSSVKISAAIGSTVYLLVNNNPALVRTLNDIGWIKIKEEASYNENNKQYTLGIFRMDAVDQDKTITLTGPEWAGFIVASKNLTISASLPNKAPVNTVPIPVIPARPSNIRATPGATTQPAVMQASIKALEVYTQNSGMMLGKTSEVTLTLQASVQPRQISVQFVTSIGNNMKLAQDEALRFIRLSYPNWNVEKAELSFEDKYVNHDGGSIGAAIGTLILATIEGTRIDPDIAITGDISANGKVRGIGGVSAKIRGAIAEKCWLVAIPEENESQLIDAVVYNGNSLITDIQVIGLSNLKDAVSVTRDDREATLKEALELFATVQKSIQEKPANLQSKVNKDKLEQVLKLAPNHMSARLLLSISQGKQPKALSPTASLYYMSVAVSPMIEFLNSDAGTQPTKKVPTATLQQAQADLTKLTKLADEKIKPLIKAWSRFIDAWGAFQSGRGSPENVRKQSLALKGEMSKVQADSEMMQNMLKEGI